MPVASYSEPSASRVTEVVNTSLRVGDVIIACANCEVGYDGRASGYLGPGQRIVLCKPDGTMLVHQPRGHDPVNWQPPGSTITARSIDRGCCIEARRSTPTEFVRVTLLETYSVTRFAAEDAVSLDLSGTEAEMHEFVKANPDVIEEGLRITEHERETIHGHIDMFGTDTNGRPVIIEVKRRQATLSHVDQLNRYVSVYAESNPAVRGILVAPDASEKVKRTLRDNELEYVQLDAFQHTSSRWQGTTLTDFSDSSED